MTPQQATADELTAVYHLFDETHTVIYVGMTGDIPTRFSDHFRLKPWRREVARYSITWYATRAEAEQVETADIDRLRPRYNIAGNAARPRKAGGNTMRDIVAVLGGQIQSGALNPGDRIPSMAAFKKMFSRPVNSE